MRHRTATHQYKGSYGNLQRSLRIFFSPPQYEAIIDDNVKISEFEEKYKIIEKRGDIYVIEEIESNDE